MFLERLIQHVRPGKWSELEALDKRYDAIESKCGFPAKRRYQALFSGYPGNVLIIEREWESLAKLEAAYMESMNDPEMQKLQDEIVQVLESNQNELYSVLP
jgi:hypothetical protein